MAISLEKVLEMSFKAYCDEKGKSKSDYTTKLLSYPLSYSGGQLDELDLNKFNVNPKEEIAKLAPEDAEVVVSFRIDHYGEKDLEAYGTALIPN